MSEDKIVLKDGIFFREKIISEKLGTETAILHQFAMKNSLICLGEIFTINNPFKEILEESQDSYPVIMWDSGAERVYDVVMNEFPILGFWEPCIYEGQLYMSIIIKHLEDHNYSAETLEKPVLFKIPKGWGRLHNIFTFDKKDNTLSFTDAYMVWENDDKVTHINHKYYRTSLPNTFTDARICLGKGYNNIKCEPTDEKYLQYLFKWLYNSRWNKDLRFNAEWLYLDTEMNPVPLDEHPMLISIGSEIDSEVTSKAQAKIGLFSLFAKELGGIIKDESNVLRFLK